jgi:hypothetical protein
VDVGFKEVFTIVRPTQEYEMALAMLSDVFIGSEQDLYKCVEYMTECARQSFMANGLSMPPWREGGMVMKNFQHVVLERDRQRVMLVERFVRQEQQAAQQERQEQQEQALDDEETEDVETEAPAKVVILPSVKLKGVLLEVGQMVLEVAKLDGSSRSLSSSVSGSSSGAASPNRKSSSSGIFATTSASSSNSAGPQNSILNCITASRKHVGPSHHHHHHHRARWPPSSTKAAANLDATGLSDVTASDSEGSQAEI